MGFNKNTKTSWIIYNDGMLYENSWNWSNDGHRIGNGGAHDALWRTGVAYIAYNDKDILDGIKSCFHFNTFIGKYYVARHNKFTPNYIDHPDWTDKKFNLEYLDHSFYVTTSRDQLLMALASMKLRGNDDLVKEYCSKMPWRLSLRFTQTPDYWCWLQNLQNKKTIPLYLLNSITHYMAVKLWNPFIKRFFPKYFDDLRVYGFSYFLTCFQTVTSTNFFGFRYLAAKILLAGCEKSNICLRLLLGDTTVTHDDISSVKPKDDFQWQRFQETDENICKILTEEQAEFNAFDIDILDNCKNIGLQINSGINNIRI